MRSKVKFFSFAHLLRIYRAYHQLSQAELAEKIGRDVAFVSRVERDKANLSPYQREKIVEDLNWPENMNIVLGLMSNMPINSERYKELMAEGTRRFRRCLDA